MVTRFVRSAVTAGVLAGGMVALTPAIGHAQVDVPLPLEGGGVTMIGCVARNSTTGDGAFILQNTMIATAANAPDMTCAPQTNQSAVVLEHVHVAIDDSMVGHWVQVSGKLEDSDDDASIREMHVKSLRLLPVRPRVAETPPPPVIYVMPAPAPAVEAPKAAEAPVATSGVIELPKTASSLPLVGAIGLLSLAGGFIFSAVRRRHSR